MMFQSSPTGVGTSHMDKLVITVLEAKCLGPKSGQTDKLNPYARLRSNFSNQVYKTKVIEKNSLDPKWHESFKFYPTDYPPTGAITIKFFERNLILKDTFLGEAVLDISQYSSEPEHDVWLFLHDEPKKKPAIRGEVHLHVSYMPAVNKGYISPPPSSMMPRASSQPYLGLSAGSPTGSPTSNTAPSVMMTNGDSSSPSSTSSPENGARRGTSPNSNPNPSVKIPSPKSTSAIPKDKKDEKFLDKNDVFNMAVKTASPKSSRSEMKIKSANMDVSILRIEDKYEIGPLIGKGSFGSVYKGKNNFTGEEVAIKVINKRNIKSKEVELLTREVKIMKKLRHPNIVRLHDLFDGPSKLFIVLELVPGGELFDQIVNKGSYSELDAKHIIQQLLGGVEYMHKNGVVHRDLKPENLLCVDEHTIKIADFGMSKDVENMGSLITTVGTPSYIAPEVLLGGPYDAECDIWSIGVLSYVLLCGFTPFHGENQKQLFDRILNAQVEFFSPEWDEVSNEAQIFVKALLQRDPSKRPSATEALNHSWFQKSRTVGKLTNMSKNLTIMKSQRIDEETNNVDEKDDEEDDDESPY